jgi:acyl-[acyl-carrier-protein]-phospholipid O-acyltransferase / long-chain-fatty-acid--[acyl-carrier-protein] ligase
VQSQLSAPVSFVTFSLTLFSLGVGLGAYFCQKLTKGQAIATYAPLAGLLMSLAMFFLAFQASTPQPATITSPAGIKFATGLFILAVGGGIFSIPLMALMQLRSKEESRSRTIAANNIVNALFMAVGTGLISFSFAMGATYVSVFTILGALNLLVSAYIVLLVPEALTHTVFKWILEVLFKVQVNGLENYTKAGPRKVIIANHVSFLDAVLLTVFLPERPTFAINTEMAKKWWIKPGLWFVNSYAVDPTSPMAIKSLTDLAKKGVPVVIFPEGRLTTTGGLMKVYEGPGVVADKADADLIPIQLSGVHHTQFTRIGGKIKKHWFPRLTLTVLPPQKFHPPSNITGRAARQWMSKALYDLLANMYVQTAPAQTTLFKSLLNASHLYGSKLPILEDVSFKPVTYRKLIAAALMLGRKLTAETTPGEHVGLLVPNSSAAVVSLFGLQAYLRVPVMLNYSTGSANILSACKTANIKQIWTSAKFVEIAKQEECMRLLAQNGISINYLETTKSKTIGDYITLLLGLLTPNLLYSRQIASWSEFNCKPASTLPSSPAIVLFTSGSSGVPKGVVLSHVNLQTNRYQILSRIDFTSRDKVFNVLPIFHSFGLTAGTLTPILSGIPVFMYPTPLHYGVIPELIYNTNATVFFATNTFLSAYAKKAHPYDFYSIRYVFAGAEKLKDTTREQWAQFGVRVFEGYGATETAPVLTLNFPMYNKLGTVGKFVPGINYKLEAIPGIDKGGRLFVHGNNIMMGYYMAENPGLLCPPPEGWYDTGDIVTVTDDFVTIQGRAKRFAKLGGEMVSLTAVEDLVSSTSPLKQHAVLAGKHPSKGEQLVLVTDDTTLTSKQILQIAREKGLSELFVPRSIYPIKAIPVLGTGKPDYVSLEKQFAAELSGATIKVQDTEEPN